MKPLAVLVALFIMVVGIAGVFAPGGVMTIGGAVIVIAGLATPLFGVERVRAILEWESTQGTALVRIGAALGFVIGGLIAFAVTTRRRPA